MPIINTKHKAMKFSKLILSVLFVIYATSIFAFQLSPDSGAAIFIDSIFGDHFVTINAFSAMVTLVTGSLSSLLSKVPGIVKLIVALLVSILGSLVGWFFSLGIFLDLSIVESIQIGWTVAGGATLIHSILKQIGLVNLIKGFFGKKIV